MAVSSRYAGEGLPSARDDFLRRFPAYAATAAVDELRAADYARLDRLGHAYLDYTGGGLYAESQLRRHHELLCRLACSATRIRTTRPRSPRPSSPRRRATPCAASSTPPRTSSRSSSRPTPAAPSSWSARRTRSRPGGVFLLSYDNHNSVNGIREFACRRGAAATYIPVREQDLRLDEEQVRTALRGAGRRTAGRRAGEALRLPGAVQLQRRPASARVGRRGARARLGRPARLRRLRADQPAGRRGDRRRLRPDLLLQAVRLPDRQRLPDRPPRGAGQAAPAVVRRRHHHARLGAERRLVPPRARRHRVRGRHHRLPRAAGGHDRRRAPGEGRHAT